MTNVSWYGAAAYSLWVNGLDWRLASDGVCCLPTESQWERAAAGAYSEEGKASSTIVAGLHEPGRAYDFAALPFAAVNEDRGVSDFGLRHAAGNVWEWCRDWYAPDFYRSPDASRRNAENTTETGVRCERGGSWVGPLELCRPTYRRGREPSAVGRCLGFRCVTVMEPTS